MHTSHTSHTPHIHLIHFSCKPHTHTPHIHSSHTLLTYTPHIHSSHTHSSHTPHTYRTLLIYNLLAYTHTHASHTHLTQGWKRSGCCVLQIWLLTGPILQSGWDGEALLNSKSHSLESVGPTAFPTATPLPTCRSGRHGSY